MENAAQLAPMVKDLLNYGVATLCTVAALIGIAWHFWKLKPTLDAQNQLILNNTLATQALSSNTKATATILDKVSDKLIAHDERTLGLLQHLATCTDGLNQIKESMATIRMVEKVHERIDKIPDKEDISLVHASLGKIQDEVQEINLQVNKIAGKVGC